MKFIIKVLTAFCLAVTIAFGSVHSNANAHIYWVAPPGQFQIDAIRPAWMDAAAAMPVLAGQSLNHIIPFEAIQNDLAITLNAIVNNNTPANQQRLINLTDALFPTLGTVARGNMVIARTALLQSINAGAVGNYHNNSRALLSRLNSSPDNIRAGNAAINLAIGQNLDVDFNPGTIPFPGIPVNTIGPPPVAGTLILTLTPASNLVVYRYQLVTTQPMTFVISPVTNRQLSSVAAPTVGPVAPPPHPVLVIDPVGGGIPFLYQ